MSSTKFPTPTSTSRVVSTTLSTGMIVNTPGGVGQTGRQGPRDEREGLKNDFVTTSLAHPTSPSSAVSPSSSSTHIGIPSIASIMNPSSLPPLPLTDPLPPPPNPTNSLPPPPPPPDKKIQLLRRPTTATGLPSAELRAEEIIKRIEGSTSSRITKSLSDGILISRGGGGGDNRRTGSEGSLGLLGGPVASTSALPVGMIDKVLNLHLESRGEEKGGEREIEQEEQEEQEAGQGGDTLDPALRTALLHPRDRILLLRAELEMELFLSDHSRTRLPLAPPHFPPALNSYQRLLVHRLADTFGITRQVENLQQNWGLTSMGNLSTTTGIVVLVKGAETRLPQSKLAVQVPASVPLPSTNLLPSTRAALANNLRSEPTSIRSDTPQSLASSESIPSISSPSASASASASVSPPGSNLSFPPSPLIPPMISPPPIQQQFFKILPRSHGTHSSSTSSTGAEEDRRSGSRKGLSRKVMSLEERELAYKEARERIFSVEEREKEKEKEAGMKEPGYGTSEMGFQPPSQVDYPLYYQSEFVNSATTTLPFLRPSAPSFDPTRMRMGMGMGMGMGNSSTPSVSQQLYSQQYGQEATGSNTTSPVSDTNSYDRSQFMLQQMQLQLQQQHLQQLQQQVASQSQSQNPGSCAYPQARAQARPPIQITAPSPLPNQATWASGLFPQPSAVSPYSNPSQQFMPSSMATFPPPPPPSSFSQTLAQSTNPYALPLAPMSTTQAAWSRPAIHSPALSTSSGGSYYPALPSPHSSSQISSPSPGSNANTSTEGTGGGYLMRFPDGAIAFPSSSSSIASTTTTTSGGLGGGRISRSVSSTSSNGTSRTASTSSNLRSHGSSSRVTAGGGGGGGGGSQSENNKNRRDHSASPSMTSLVSASTPGEKWEGRSTGTSTSGGSNSGSGSGHSRRERETTEKGKERQVARGTGSSRGSGSERGEIRKKSSGSGGGKDRVFEGREDEGQVPLPVPHHSLPARPSWVTTLPPIDRTSITGTESLIGSDAGSVIEEPRTNHASAGTFVHSALPGVVYPTSLPSAPSHLPVSTSEVPAFSYSVSNPILQYPQTSGQLIPPPPPPPTFWNPNLLPANAAQEYYNNLALLQAQQHYIRSQQQVTQPLPSIAYQPHYLPQNATLEPQTQTQRSQPSHPSQHLYKPTSNPSLSSTTSQHQQRGEEELHSMGEMRRPPPRNTELFDPSAGRSGGPGIGLKRGGSTPGSLRGLDG